MDDVELTLRQTLDAHATAAPSGDHLLQEVRRRGTAQRTRRRAGAAVVAVAAVAGIAMAVTSGLNPLRSSGDLVTTDTDPTPVADPQIVCGPGGTPFDPDLLVERPAIDPEADLGIPVGTTARPHIARRLIDHWTLLGRRGATVDLLIWLKPSDEGANIATNSMVAVTYEQAADGAWSFRSSGGCDPQRLFDDGLNSAEWTLAGDPPGPEATAVTILVSEYSCHDGTTAQRLTTPEVEYRDDAVVITTRVEPPEGDAFTCVGYPPTELTVELDEPLGDRRLLDGMWWPARDVTQVQF